MQDEAARSHACRCALAARLFDPHTRLEGVDDSAAGHGRHMVVLPGAAMNDVSERTRLAIQLTACYVIVAVVHTHAEHHHLVTAERIGERFPELFDGNLIDGRCDVMTRGFWRLGGGHTPRGAGGETRYRYGLELAQQGYASTVVMSNPEHYLDDTGLCAERLPSIRVECFAPDPSTTRGEAQHLRDIAEQRKGPNLVRLFRFQVARAAGLLRNGSPLGLRLGGRFGFEVRLVVLAGARVLQKLHKQDDIFAGARLHAGDRLLIMARALTAGVQRRRDLP